MYNSNKLYKRRFAHTKQMPEITLTPLIDTSLTILVIFMITAPSIQNSIKVNLPYGQYKEADKEKPNVFVSIDQEERIYINNEEVPFEDIVTHLDKVLPDYQKGVVLQGDRFLPYNAIMTVMDKVKQLKRVQYVVLSTKST